MPGFEGGRTVIRIQELNGAAQSGRLFIRIGNCAPFDIEHLSVTEQYGISGFARVEVDIKICGRDHFMFWQRDNNVLEVQLPSR